MENQAVSGTTKPLFGGRKPLFTQKELLLLTGQRRGEVAGAAPGVAGRVIKLSAVQGAVARTDAGKEGRAMLSDRPRRSEDALWNLTSLRWTPPVTDQPASPP